MAPKKRAAASSEPSKKRAKKPKESEATGKAEATDKSEARPAAAGIIVEAWANKLEKLLKEAKPDLEVTINPDKPRKGCFEVRQASGDKVFVSLLDTPRPFQKLKALDIEELAKTILADS